MIPKSAMIVKTTTASVGLFTESSVIVILVVVYDFHFGTIGQINDTFSYDLLSFL